MKSQKIIFRCLFILFLIIFIFMIFHFISKAKSFKEHKNYFDLPTSEKHIEDWMTLRLVEHDFGVKIDKTLNVKLSVFDMKKSLKEYCEDENLNCNEVISQLEENKKIKDNKPSK